MNRIKSIIVILLLFAITVIVVFGPHIVNRQSDKKLTEETAYWNYNNQNAAKITDKQVAALYCNGGININIYSSVNGGSDFKRQNYDNAKTKENISALLDVVFASDETIRSCIKQTLSESNIVSQSGILTVIDTRPVVLDFVYVVAETNYGTFEFNFEQKTQTLINFSYYSVYPLDYTNSIKSENLEAAINDYYKNRLGLSEKQFFYQYETAEENDFKDFCAYAGILNYQEEIEKEEKIEDYTF